MEAKDADRVFLTGTTGFIGSHVAEFFCKKGVDVLCAVRKTSDLSFLETLPAKLIMTDLLDPDSLAQAVSHASFVVHTAGLVNDWSSYHDFFGINVVGTRNLMNACVAAGVRNVIITGSSASYGEEDFAGIKSEESPDNPRYPYFLEKMVPNRLNFYRITKHMAIKEAEKIAAAHTMNLTVIEPVWVYGEREFSSGFYEYMKTISSGIPFFPGSVKNHFHVIYAGELARAYFQAYEKRPSGVNRVLIGNHRIDSMHEIYALFCKEMGIKKPLNLPRALVYPIGLVMELAAEAFHWEKPPLLSRSRVNMMYDNIAYNTAKAEKLLGFRTEMPIGDSIALTVQWYKMNKLI
jgi:nucleoside-diphosphate-sugar epimerase